MTTNVGTLDRAIRFALAAAFFSFYFWAAGPLRFVALVGFVPLLTGALGACPLYSVLGVQTCAVKR